MIVEFEEQYRKQLWPHLDEENRELFSNSLFKKFLFVSEGIVQGWVLLQPSRDRLIIDWIFVLEKFRKQKIGSQLLDYVKEFARNASFRGLSVNTGSNTLWARRFYEKNGFEQVGLVKKFFSFDPEHIFYWFEL